MKGFIDKAVFVETDNFIVQFFRYGIVGVIAAVVNIGMLYILTELLGLHYIFSNILAFTLGLIANYFLSVRYVFSKERKKDRKLEFIAYVAFGLIGLFLDTLLIYLLTEKINLYYMASKIISTGIVFVYNFAARKIFHQIGTEEKQRRTHVVRKTQ